MKTRIKVINKPYYGCRFDHVTRVWNENKLIDDFKYIPQVKVLGIWFNLSSGYLDKFSAQLKIDKYLLPNLKKTVSYIKYP